jgi:hypothetical protein
LRSLVGIKAPREGRGHSISTGDPASLKPVPAIFPLPLATCVSEILPHCPERSQLFSRQDAAHSSFSLYPHPQRCRLRFGDVTQVPLDDSLIGIIGIQHFFKCQIGLAQAFINRRSLISHLFTNCANALALFRSQVQISNGITANRGLLPFRLLLRLRKSGKRYHHHRGKY